MLIPAIRRGQNAMVQQSRPNANLSSLAFPSIASGTRYLFLSMPVTGITGQTVVSATLSGRIRGNASNQQLAVQPVAAAWSVGKITWANQPGVRAASAVLSSTGTLADGDRVEVDITALVQQIANGQPHYGWRLATTGEAFFYGFADPDSWTLTIETSDAPQRPEVLQPDAGVIGKSKFTVRTDFTDLGGSTDQAAIQVQVDPDATAPIAWDSGEVATTVPELDLATTSYPGLASGATTRWRARVKDSDGYWSLYSDWATVTRIAKPTLVVDAPTGGLLFDSTPVVQAHITSGTIKSWSIMVTDGIDRTAIRYDSGRQTATSSGGTAIALAIPLRNDDGQVVFRDDRDYFIRIRVWDRTDRVRGAADDPPYIEAWVPVAFDDDAAVVPPDTLAATSDGRPQVTLSWTRPGTADAWEVSRDGARFARLDPDDVDLDAGTYSWVDTGATPNEQHTWQVRAITNDRRGEARSVTATVPVKGVWLMSKFGDVVLDGSGVRGLSTKDRRATYRLPNRRDDVDIIGALEGISGIYEGALWRTPGRRTEAAFDADRAILRRIRRDPTTPVRLVYGTVSVPVLLRSLSITPDDDFLPNTRAHTVSFECFQVGDFDEV